MEEVKGKKKSNSVLVWILVIIVIGLVGYIVYTDYVRPSLLKDNEFEEKEESNEGETEEKKEVPLANKVEMLELAGIKLNVPTNLCGGEVESVFFRNTGTINSFSSVDKWSIVYDYARDHNMLWQVGGEREERCQAGSGYCDFIRTDYYSEIAKKYGITDHGDAIFGHESNYNNGNYSGYLTYFGGTTCSNDLLTHNSVSFEYKGDDIIMVDNISINNTDTNNEEKKVVTYTFKKNGNDYYLYSVA